MNVGGLGATCVNSPGSGSLAINGVSQPGKPCCVTYMFGKLMCYHEIHHILVWLSGQCDVSVAGMSERERERDRERVF